MRSLFLAALLLGGCEPTQLAALEPADVSTARSQPPADLDDPFGAVLGVIDAAPDGLPPAFTCTDQRAGTFGWSEACDAGACWHNVSCQHRCERDSECPVPRSGDARPVCSEAWSSCVLPCEPDETRCPQGFVCADTTTLNQLPGEPERPAFMCMQRFELDQAAR